MQNKVRVIAKKGNGFGCAAFTPRRSTFSEPEVCQAVFNQSANDVLISKPVNGNFSGMLR